MQLVIPTRRKEDLPAEFSYLLWPSKVTEFLKDTPQRHDAELVFHWRDEFWESHWRRRIAQRGRISLVSAEYTTNWSPYFPKWKINIYSVPNEFTTPAHEILFDGAMEELAERLKQHGLTPDHPVHETITMNLDDCEHDLSRLTPEQLAREEEEVA